jgi:ArsR family transcriptional regulator
MSNNQIAATTDVAEMFKALSNPHRVAIFQRLISCCVPGTRCSPDERGSECVGDLGRDLGIAPSTVSHHIKELRRAGLIHVERRGQKVECWIEPGTLDALSQFFVRP